MSVITLFSPAQRQTRLWKTLTETISVLIIHSIFSLPYTTCPFRLSPIFKLGMRKSGKFTTQSAVLYLFLCWSLFWKIYLTKGWSESRGRPVIIWRKDMEWFCERGKRGAGIFAGLGTVYQRFEASGHQRCVGKVKP